MTPLTAAIASGRTDIAAAIIAKGANPNSADGSEEKPLIIAVRLRQVAMVTLLLSRKQRTHMWSRTATGRR